MRPEWAAVFTASLLAALCDLGARKIPNVLTGPVFLLGLGWAFYAHGGWEGVLGGILGSLILSGPFIFLFVFTPAGGAAADAKLMAAFGPWLGWRTSVPTLACVAIAGLVLAVVYSLSKRQLRVSLKNLSRIVQALIFWVFGKFRLSDAQVLLPEPKELQAMPYGVSIFVGVCAAAGGSLLWGW
jgi:Flp pilus assembly protein protease CpaA